MKDLGNVRKILEMVIKINREKDLLTVSQESYLNKVLIRFGMKKAKSVNILLATHMNLSHSQSPKIEIELREIKKHTLC